MAWGLKLTSPWSTLLSAQEAHLYGLCQWAPPMGSHNWVGSGWIWPTGRFSRMGGRREREVRSSTLPPPTQGHGPAKWPLHTALHPGSRPFSSPHVSRPWGDKRTPMSGALCLPASLHPAQLCIINRNLPSKDPL